MTENPLDVCGILGGSIQLSCAASGVSAAVVQWKKGNSSLRSSKKYIIVSKKTESYVTSNLTITNLQFADVGSDYLCEFGVASFPSLNQSTSAAVSGKSMTRQQILRQKVSVCCYTVVLGTIERFENRTLVSNGLSLAPLMCTFTANPEPSTELLFEDNRIMPVMVNLTAKHTWTVMASLGRTALQAAGKYTCRISCKTPVSVSQIARLGGTQIDVELVSQYGVVQSVFPCSAPCDFWSCCDDCDGCIRQKCVSCL